MHDLTPKAVSSAHMCCFEGFSASGWMVANWELTVTYLHRIAARALE